MKLTMVLLEIRARFPGFSGYYSEGVASIAATVKKAGYRFELIHLTQPVPPDRLALHVARTDPDVIGFSCMTHTFPYLEWYAPAVKSRLPGRPILVGGVHAILRPEECLAVDGVDAACLGEGEEVSVCVLDRLDRGLGIEDLPGIWVKASGTIRRNPVAPLVEDLDSLPPPDRTIFDPTRIMSTQEGVLYVFASRGCPYNCRFCCNEAIRMHFPNGGKYLRYKSVPRLCDEIESAVKLFPGRLRGIYFQDEILGLNKKWLTTFAQEYRRRVGIPFNCNLRADLVTPELVDRLRHAGCCSVSIGLESGSERIRSAVLGKKIADRDYHAAFEMLSDAGIRINTFSMVGLPNETCDDALATVHLNSDARVSKAMVSIFFPYPGTELYETCVANGMLSQRLPDTYQETTPLDQATISRVQVEFIHDYFALLVAMVRCPWANVVLRWVLCPLIRQDGLPLRVLSALKRGTRHIAIPVYMYLGRHFFSRQSRVFWQLRRVWLQV